MLATRDKAARIFAKFLPYAKGNSYYVYRAFRDLKDPTEQDVIDYIQKLLEEDGIH